MNQIWRAPMNPKLVFTVQSIFFFLAGLGPLLIPQQFIDPVGVTLGEGGIGLAGLYGATAIMFGLITWFAREAGPSTTRKALVFGQFDGNLLAALSGFITVYSVVLARSFRVGLLSGPCWLLTLG